MLKIISESRLFSYITCSISLITKPNLICEIILFSMRQYHEMTYKFYNIFDTYLLGDSGVRGAVGVDSKTWLFPLCWLLVYPFCNGCRFTMLPLSSTSLSKNRYLQTTFPHNRTTYFSKALTMGLFFLPTTCNYAQLCFTSQKTSSYHL
jgi:hypothetical protein